jgi:hypothetical protein
MGNAVKIIADLLTENNKYLLDISTGIKDLIILQSELKIKGIYLESLLTRIRRDLDDLVYHSDDESLPEND